MYGLWKDKQKTKETEWNMSGRSQNIAQEEKKNIANCNIDRCTVFVSMISLTHHIVRKFSVSFSVDARCYSLVFFCFISFFSLICFIYFFFNLFVKIVNYILSICLLLSVNVCMSDIVVFVYHHHINTLTNDQKKKIV